MSAEWDDQAQKWTFADAEGRLYKTRFFVSCLGFLSQPTLPDVPGVADFAGEAFHTSRWPRDIDLRKYFAGKRIGVVGTGATGIQTITALSKLDTIKSLKVFQRTANWIAPLRNASISSEDMANVDYDSLFAQCAASPSGFLHKADPRSYADTSPEERLALWEKMYAAPGFSKWLGGFKDTFTDRHANAAYSAFIAGKIRERVHDPETAESLIPKSHGFGTRRVPLESGYFEAFNKEHISLVDLQKTPITCITKQGITTSDGIEHELDILIYATGFDAITGAFNAIQWKAKDGRPLVGTHMDGPEPVWPNHCPRTFLGLTAPAMPNMFMILGPHQMLGNATRSIEYATKVILDLLQYCKDHDITYVEPKQEAVDAWTDHVAACSKGSLINEVDSWMTGINKNVAGKTIRNVARYTGTAQEFRRRCEECKASNYRDLIMTKRSVAQQ